MRRGAFAAPRSQIGRMRWQCNNMQPPAKAARPPWRVFLSFQGREGAGTDRASATRPLTRIEQLLNEVGGGRLRTP